MPGPDSDNKSHLLEVPEIPENHHRSETGVSDNIRGGVTMLCQSGLQKSMKKAGYREGLHDFTKGNHPGRRCFKNSMDGFLPGSKRLSIFVRSEFFASHRK
ncbi:hypothetical protein [Burkholderia gladioli]|uniref:hypothetical protein n=1 Tax=Burkholderia gladioli TaxID=28095 RepID=UPI00163F6BCC|nr:hypothetical protein [Burkholderia gladioli]